jgi:hypothetical protein
MSLELVRAVLGYLEVVSANPSAQGDLPAPVYADALDEAQAFGSDGGADGTRPASLTAAEAALRNATNTAGSASPATPVLGTVSAPKPSLALTVAVLVLTASVVAAASVETACAVAGVLPTAEQAAAITASQDALRSSVQVAPFAGMAPGTAGYDPRVSGTTDRFGAPLPAGYIPGRNTQDPPLSGAGTTAVPLRSAYPGGFEPGRFAPGVGPDNLTVEQAAALNAMNNAATGGHTMSAVHVSHIRAMWENLTGALKSAGIIPS